MAKISLFIGHFSTYFPLKPSKFPFFPLWPKGELLNQRLNVGLSRNINPRWYIGLNGKIRQFVATGLICHFLIASFKIAGNCRENKLFIFFSKVKFGPSPEDDDGARYWCKNIFSFRKECKLQCEAVVDFQTFELKSTLEWPEN